MYLIIALRFPHSWLNSIWEGSSIMESRLLAMFIVWNAGYACLFEFEIKHDIVHLWFELRNLWLLLFYCCEVRNYYYLISFLLLVEEMWGDGVILPLLSSLFLYSNYRSLLLLLFFSLQVLVVAVLAIFPLVPKNLSNHAYRLSLMGTACSSLYSLYSIYGVTLMFIVFD